MSEQCIQYDIWVMDDHSPDGTFQVAEGLKNKYPVHAVDRKGKMRSLSAAVLDGFEQAKGDIVVVMDADLSHPTSALPHMVDLIESKQADIVVGSRNIKGGGSDSWPFYRQWISQGASWLTFGLTPMTDPTTGFMAIKRSLLSFKKYNPVGWKIVLEIVAKHPKAKLKEVPIIFQDRQHGSSKMNPKEQLRYLRHLLRLYDVKWPAFGEFVRYGIVGLSGVFVDTLFSGGIIFLGGSYSDLPREQLLSLAIFVGFSLACTSNFALNRYWTFKAGRAKPLASSYIKYTLVNSLGLSSRILFGWMMASSFLAWPLQLINILGICVATAVNFFGAKYWVFRPK